MSEKEIKKVQRDKTLKKAKKIVGKIDDSREAVQIVNILMASFDLSTEHLYR